MEARGWWEIKNYFNRRKRTGRNLILNERRWGCVYVN